MGRFEEIDYKLRITELCVTGFIYCGKRSLATISGIALLLFSVFLHGKKLAKSAVFFFFLTISK